MITYGEPRVGDEEYAKLHDIKINAYRKLRLINDNDLIAWMYTMVFPVSQHESR